MAGKNKRLIFRKDIEKLASFLDGHKCIILGGASLPFYGVLRGTVDIDIEVCGADRIALDVIGAKISLSGIEADITGDSSGWGMIPLPKGYRDRVLATGIPNVSILDPVDFILGKLGRGIETDVQDCMNVIKTQDITKDDIKDRLSLVVLPKDPVSGIYLKRVNLMCDNLFR